LEPKEYEENWKQKNTKKTLEPKKYERNWKQKNMKDTGTKRI
jgi:hypothetical protein